MRDGYEKVSIRQIAKEIEYSPATIYLYFKDKDDIFYELHKIGFEKLKEKMLQVTISIENPLERLRETGKAYINFGFENPEFYNLMFITKAPMRKIKECKKWNCGFDAFNSLLQVVQACVDAKEFESENIEATSIAFWSSCHGLVSLVLRDRFLMFPEEKLNKLIRDTTNFILKMKPA